MKDKLARRLAHMVPVGCDGENGTYGDFDKLHPEQRAGLEAIAQAMIDEISVVIADSETPDALIAQCTPNDAFQLGLMSAISVLKHTSVERTDENA